MASKKKFYVVLKGRRCGIFQTWEDCEAQVKGFKGSKYKGFKTLQEAQDWIVENEEPQI